MGDIQMGLRDWWLSRGYWLAAHKGNAAWLQDYLRFGVDVNLAHRKSGMTALMIASANGYVDVASVLIAAGADTNLKEPRHGMTALMHAALNGRADVAQLLLNAGADPGAVDNDGVEAWMYAEGAGHSDIVNLVVKRAFSASRNVQRSYTAAPSEPDRRRITRLHEFAQRVPSSAVARLALGHGLMDAGDVDRALAEYQEAVRLNPHLVGAHHALGRAFQNKGDFQSAMRAYRDGIQLEPDDPYPRLDLATCCHVVGDTRSAISEIGIAIELLRRVGDDRMNLAIAEGWLADWATHQRTGGHE
jgi:tetratricopeptide (TPR) repeat protein